jgi:hypothetical protein
MRVAHYLIRPDHDPYGVAQAMEPMAPIAGLRRRHED